MSKPCVCEACKDKTRGYAIVLFRRSNVDTYYCAQGYRTMEAAIKCMQRWNSTFPGDAFIKVIKL